MFTVEFLCCHNVSLINLNVICLLFSKNFVVIHFLWGIPFLFDDILYILGVEVLSHYFRQTPSVFIVGWVSGWINQATNQSVHTHSMPHRWQILFTFFRTTEGTRYRSTWRHKTSLKYRRRAKSRFLFMWTYWFVGWLINWSRLSYSFIKISQVLWYI